MNIAQKLTELLDSRKISRSKLAREIGVHTSTVSNWLDGKDVKSENLATLCSYFDCSLDYLLGTTDELLEKEHDEKMPTLTKKDERDIARRLEALLGDMGDGALMFDGEPVDEETLDLLRTSLQHQLELAKKVAKAKYTPKKYGKED